MFKIMRFLRSLKCSKTTIELMFTTCSVFDWKYPFWVNLVRKLKIFSSSWNLVLRLIQICRIPLRCSFHFCFRADISFWADLVQKIKIVRLSWNLLLKLIWIYRIQWWCSRFCFKPENQNCQFKLKFGSKSNSNMQNLMMTFTFPVFDHKYPSWGNLVQKLKIVQSEIWYND